MKHVGSALTGLIGQTAKPESQNADGPPAGRAGAVASPQDIAAWLASHSPAEVEAAALSRATRHGVALRVRYEGRYPDGGPSYTLAVGCEIGEGGNLEAAEAELVKFMTPAPLRDIEAWLAELSVITARRKGDDFSEGLALTAYAGRLARYPADVARAVTVGRSWQYWPTWAELERACEIMAAPRRQMLAAIRRGYVAPEPDWRPPTDAERARIAALVAEKFPAASAEWQARAVAEVTKGMPMKGPEQ